MRQIITILSYFRSVYEGKAEKQGPRALLGHGRALRLRCRIQRWHDDPIGVFRPYQNAGKQAKGAKNALFSPQKSEYLYKVGIFFKKPLYKIYFLCYNVPCITAARLHEAISHTRKTPHGRQPKV